MGEQIKKNNIDDQSQRLCCIVVQQMQIDESMKDIIIK
mgnify:CR=1 FL=1